MHSRFTRFAAGATIALSLFGAAGMAQASSLTSTQISAIIGLLQSFGADQGTINSVQASLGGSNQGDTLFCNSFADVSYGQFDETRGGRVSQLQTWLGIPSNTFGFGTYGRKTKTLWNVKCGGDQQQTNATFSATPTSGVAPVDVTFKTFSPLSGFYTISYGDGTTGSMGHVFDSCRGTKDYCNSKPISEGYHSYTSAGTYIATLKDSSGSIVATVAVTVTGQTSDTPTATIDQGSLTTTMNTPTITGTISGTSEICVAVGRNTSASTNWNGVVNSTSYNFKRCYHGGFDPSIISISNGRWSVNPSTLTSGTYTVGVYDGADTADFGNLLTSGTLAINTTATSGIPTATQNQSTITLLQSFGASAGTISNVQQALNGSMVAAPAPASLTTTQVSAVIQLLQQWGINSAIVSNVSAILQGQPALTITPVQIQSVVTLLQSFNASAGTISNVQNILAGQTVYTPAPVSLTTTQVSAVIQLLQQWGVSQTLITRVSTALNGQ